jgi:hypothetical protein
MPGEQTVVQIRGAHRWAGALAIVDDVRPWGVIAFVPIPHNNGEPTGPAYTRLETGEYVIIGHTAIWPPDKMP